MAGLTVQKANSGGNLSVGTSTGAQPTAAVPRPIEGQAIINQTPIVDGTTGGGGGGGTGLGGGAVGPSSAQVNPLLAALSSLDTILNNRLGNARSTYDRFISQYNDQDNLDRQAFDTQTQSNNENLAGDRQAALLNAARGGVGLRSVLSSLGALAGSGENLIRRLVGSAANEDVGEADSAFKTNATNLNTAWGQTEQQQRQRRIDADANLFNDEQNARADVLNSRKSTLEQLAQLYGSGSAQGSRYAGEATSIVPQIAATTKAATPSYAAASSLFSPQALTNYLAGTKDLTVNTSGGSQTPINSPAFVTPRREDRLSGVA